MNRLVRAEGYRLLHSGIYLRSMLLFCLLLSLFPLLTDFSLRDKSLAENMGTFSLNGVMLIWVVPLIVTVFVANGYLKKTAYYEVMAGNKNFGIIGSKLVVDGFFMGIICFVFTIWLGVTVAVKNGIGAVEEIPLRLMLLFVICLHVTALAVLIGLAVKHPIAAAMVVYLRFQMFDLLFAEILPMFMERWALGEAVCVKLRRCTVIRQITEVFGPEIGSEIVIATLGSFLVEILLWYGIVYFTMRKKWYK